MLGAGDGFMSGLLKGWLTDQDWPTALKYANACGAFAVSRHGCTPAYPSWEELRFFLDRGIRTPALRKDAELEQIHWSTNRLRDWPEMRVFAFDHRMQLEKIADELGAAARPHRRLQAALPRRPRSEVAAGRPGYGLLCDGRLGRDALYAAAGTGLWIGRPVEDPGTRPLRLESRSSPTTARALAEWPLEHVVKVLCFYHPDDDARDEGRPGGDRRPPRPRRPRQPASSSCSRSSRPRSRRSPTPPRPRSSSASTTSASTPTGGSSSR